MTPFRKKIRRFRKRVFHALLVPVELLLVHLAMFAIPRLSRGRALGLSRFIGGCAMCLSRRDTRHMRANLRLIYGDTMDKAEEKRFMRSVWNHAGLILIDFFWFLKDTHQRVMEYVEIDPSFTALSRGTDGCLGITAHIGNWELAAHSMCEHGREVTSVFAPIGATRLTQKALLASREASGQRLVARQGAVLHLLRALRNGTIVGLLLDQFTKVTQGGMFVDFLGMPAPISKIAGVLQTRRHCAIHIVACLHQGNGHYRSFESAVLPGDSGLSEEEVTQWVADRLSDLVRQCPEQWLWMYRRWRHVKPGDDPARYPYYAHSFNPLAD